MNQRKGLPNLGNLSSDNPGLKYGTAKQLISLSSSNPELLLPHIVFFSQLLKSDNNILKWTAIDVVGNLVPFIPHKEALKNIKILYTYLRGGKLITAAHAISALTSIAMNKPEWKKRILTQLLKVEQLTYETPECLNIIIGKTLLALGNFVIELEHVKGAVDFVLRQMSNSRSATRRKAEQLLRKLRKTNLR